MTARQAINPKAFQRAMMFSVTAHVVLFTIIIASPHLPKPSSKGVIHYIPLNFVGMPGGGGRGGGGGGGAKAAPKASLAATEIKKQTLRDLTTAQKLQETPKSSLRYPVDKPKKEPKKKPDKQAVISKPDAKAKTAPSKDTESGGAAGTKPGTGQGSGLTIGAGGPGFGEGTGSGLAGQIGLSNFPYQYYLQIIRDRISSNWFTALVDPGVEGTLQTAVYFRIFRNGTISNVEVRESSSVRAFDSSAVRAIMNSAPFPPLPADYDEQYLGIILIFEHSK
jgi:TonB family protein